MDLLREQKNIHDDYTLYNSLLLLDYSVWLSYMTL